MPQRKLTDEERALRDLDAAKLPSVDSIARQEQQERREDEGDSSVALGGDDRMTELLQQLLDEVRDLPDRIAIRLGVQ